EEDGLINLNDALKKMWEKKINSVLIEGGANVFSQFLSNNLYDDIYFFIAPKIIGSGISPFESISINNLSDAYNLKLDFIKHLGDDILIHYTK
ncbi:MAG TPA: dihydrofolate reductase family protein, partial [Ignavibacteria bacterium]|nr:dihydrofolate reductase family protein [Ignavibacteria bacterium]